MKTTVFTLMMCLFWISLFAQVPDKMSYQAIVRDAAGNLVADHGVGVKISILQGTAETLVYHELFNPNPQTNSNGLVSIAVGTGIPLTGIFSGINWSAGPFFIKSEIDPTGGTNYTVTGTSQFLSVPYAFYAKDVQNKDDADADPTNEIQLLNLNSNQLSISRQGGNTVTFTNWDINSTDDVRLTGNQTISGNKTFTDTINASQVNIINVANPVNANDAATKAYVDLLLSKISDLDVLSGKIKDIDGNLYSAVKIGDQIWMTGNLKTTRLNNGNSISNNADNYIWSIFNGPAYCWFNNDVSYKYPYGAHYNWDAVNTGKLCPAGWHVPSDAEWTTLTTFLGGENVAGGKMKETGTTFWLNSNTGATNESGFSGLPGGYRSYSGDFRNIGGNGYWWSSTEYSASNAWGWGLSNYSTGADQYNSIKRYGFSIRCLRDL